MRTGPGRNGWGLFLMLSVATQSRIIGWQFGWQCRLGDMMAEQPKARGGPATACPLPVEADIRPLDGNSRFDPEPTCVAQNTRPGHLRAFSRKLLRPSSARRFAATGYHRV